MSSYFVSPAATFHKGKGKRIFGRGLWNLLMNQIRWEQFKCYKNNKRQNAVAWDKNYRYSLKRDYCNCTVYLYVFMFTFTGEENERKNKKITIQDWEMRIFITFFKGWRRKLIKIKCFKSWKVFLKQWRTWWLKQQFTFNSDNTSHNY